MKIRLRLFLVLVLLLLVGGLLLVPKVRWPIYGWLRGEAFYQGMPTSWYAKQIERRFIPLILQGHGEGHVPWLCQKERRLWDELSEYLGIGALSDGLDFEATKCLEGDPRALPLLLALLRHQSAKVRIVAISGLAGQGKENIAAIAALVGAVQDPDVMVRRNAMAALDQLGPETAAKAGVKLAGRQ